MAHQWISILVTMDWWGEDYWIKEGKQNYKKR
jgi:aminopeptidase N